MHDPTIHDPSIIIHNYKNYYNSKVEFEKLCLYKTIIITKIKILLA